MKFHGVEMKGDFICLTVSNISELGPAGIRGRLVHVETDNALYIDTSIEWKKTGIDPYLVDANTILGGIVDNVPIAISAGENQVIGRITGGNIKGLSTAELTTLVDKATSADIITGTSNTKVITPLALVTSVATSSDIVSGSSNEKPITPAGLTASRAASADIITGTSTTKVITPDSIAPIINVFCQGGTLINDIDFIRAINIPIWQATMPCTVTKVSGMRFGGDATTSFNARKNGTSNHLASAKTAASANTWYDGGTVQNTSYVKGDWLEMMVVVAGPSATQIAVQVEFTKA